jgi:hypothetical protein
MAMLAEVTARSIRVGGINIAPGSARALSIPLSARANEEKAAAVAVPAWAAVGPKAGPRITIVAALRGDEAAAAIAPPALAGPNPPAGFLSLLNI